MIIETKFSKDSDGDIYAEVHAESEPADTLTSNVWDEDRDADDNYIPGNHRCNVYRRFDTPEEAEKWTARMVEIAVDLTRERREKRVPKGRTIRIKA